LVVAPSLVPGKPGDRVKTDRRDARKSIQKAVIALARELAGFIWDAAARRRRRRTKDRVS